MQIGIYDINEGCNQDYKSRLNIYKSVGFESVALYLDNDYMVKDETYEEIISYAYKIGLKVNQIHLDYKISNDICLNISNYVNYVESKLIDCRKYGIKNAVLHASRKGLEFVVTDENLSIISNLAKKYEDVNLCFENVSNNENVERVLSLNNKNIKLCYDIGHANAYKSEYFLQKYLSKLACAHIHNNYGEDTHNMIYDGTIDVKEITRRLLKHGCDCCLEVYPKRGIVLEKNEFIQFVTKAYNDCKTI